MDSEDISGTLEVDKTEEKSEERNVVNTLQSSDLEPNLQEDLGDQIIEVPFFYLYYIYAICKGYTFPFVEYIKCIFPSWLVRKGN